MDKNLNKLMASWKWRLLLALMLFTLFFEALRIDGGGYLVAEMMSYLLFTLIFVGTERIVKLHGWARLLVWAVLVSWLLFSFTRMAGSNVYVNETTALTAVIVLGCLIVTFAELTGRTSTDVDIIYGAVFGYFLMALSWGLLYEQLERWQSGSFNLADGPHSTAAFFYFSLVTITTLGYGDILPTSPVARLAAGVEAAIGLLYVAVFIGRIVGRAER